MDILTPMTLTRDKIMLTGTIAKKSLKKDPCIWFGIKMKSRIRIRIRIGIDTMPIHITAKVDHPKTGKIKKVPVL
jgi:hypothetical protein